MLVICEDCAKKYNIDESQIKGDKAKFTCNGCGHIIVVEKPVPVAPAPMEEIVSDEETLASSTAEELLEEEQVDGAVSSTAAAQASTPVVKVKGKGMRTRSYILITMLMGVVVISSAFAYLYFKYIPEIINTQIELRTSAITESFSGVIKKPLLVRHYLQVNKEAQRVSKLPGVAYASVVNKKGIVIAGFFSDLTQFEREFEMRVKKKGFPASVLAQNKLGTGDGHARITVGGQTIYDTVVAIPDSGGVVHVGIYISEVDGAIRNALISPVTIAIAAAMVLIGLLILLFLTRTITRPMQDLTDIANRISLGELDLVVMPTGPREMRELATAFERMRFSIKAAVDRLRR